MKPFVLVTISILIILGIFFALLAYSYTQIDVTLNDVALHSIDWASLSWSMLLKLGLDALTGNWLDSAFELIQGINLNLVFGLSNNGLLPVFIPDLSYSLSVNGVNIGKGHNTVNTTINPGETKEILILQNFQKSSLSHTIESIVSNNGIMYIQIKGTAYFELLGVSIPIPFESTKQISIIDEVRTHFDSIS